ncbi:DUF6920 family protein [Noviherbaspirillum galbum]|uniref:Uncharacterized protein n=1 Tax=Noviherbaspirillum galbum TaxID=2709383 RepID=A0A6B3SWB5_9BURK|nr:DUF6544 family protein [Noviherbaspirillum galbum]NEX64848.1 hypothetical protein [Noviherbaspirillum galbum]
MTTVVRLLLLSILALMAVMVALKRYGAFRWDQETQDLRAQLEAARATGKPHRYSPRELDGLPAPVQAYFRTVLKDGQNLISAARVEHHGTFNMGDEREMWKPFSSDQRVILRRPGFDWNARVNMLPGVPVHVHDAYVGGEGILHAALLGLFTVADMRGTKAAAEGELMRFLAEAAWYPTALLPGQGVQWTSVDHHSARATLVDGDIMVSLLFTFNEQGLIDTVSAPARGRTVGDRIIPTPWQGRFWNYEVRDGMLVPLSGEVSWVPADGIKPYWRGDIRKLEYELVL